MFCPQIFGKNTKKDKNANHFQITRLVKYKKTNNSLHSNYFLVFLQPNKYIKS